MLHSDADEECLPVVVVVDVKRLRRMMMMMIWGGYDDAQVRWHVVTTTVL